MTVKSEIHFLPGREVVSRNQCICVSIFLTMRTAERQEQYCYSSPKNAEHWKNPIAYNKKCDIMVLLTSCPAGCHGCLLPMDICS